MQRLLEKCLNSNPEIIADQKKYIELNKELKELGKLVDKGRLYKDAIDQKKEAEEYISSSEDKDMIEMAKEQLEISKESINNLEDEIKILLIPKDPDDSKNVVVEIRAGTGGDEASIFAGDLFRMYSKFAQDKKWKISVVDTSEGTAGGFKEVIFEIAGEDQKSQHKNKEKAMKVLRSRLYEIELNKRMESDSQKRNELVKSGDRSAKIRTYNYPQGRVTDHRIGLTLYDLPKILDGDVSKLIDEIQLFINTEKLKEAGEV